MWRVLETSDLVLSAIHGTGVVSVKRGKWQGNFSKGGTRCFLQIVVYGRGFLQPVVSDAFCKSWHMVGRFLQNVVG